MRSMPVVLVILFSALILPAVFLAILGMAMMRPRLERYYEPMPPKWRPVVAQTKGEVKALYVTAYTLVDKKKMKKIIELIDETELNALVVNVKDGDGVYLDRQVKALVDSLKAHNICAIARLVVFQDNKLQKKRPDFALKTRWGTLWRARGYGWVDPASREVWQYNLDVALRALELGFDEINLDYVRFPSEGNLAEIVYPFYDANVPKEKVIEGFSKYIVSEIHGRHPEPLFRSTFSLTLSSLTITSASARE